MIGGPRIELQGAKGLRGTEGLRGASSLHTWPEKKTPPQKIGRQMPTVEFIVETKQRLREIPIGGDLDLIVQEYALQQTVTPEDFYTEQVDVDTGIWGGGPPEVRSNDGTHTHSITGNTGAGTEHTHTLSGSIDTEGSHIHSVTSGTDYAYGPDSHAHPVFPTDASSHTHTHTLSLADESTHTHEIDFTSDSGVSEPGLHKHNVRIPPLKVTIPILSVEFVAFGDPYVLAWRGGLFKDEYALGAPNRPGETTDLVTKNINILAV